MEFEIKQGVPLPRSRGKPRKYDLKLEDMEVKDHLFIPLPKTKIKKEIKIIRNFVLRFTHKNPGHSFSIRKMEEGVGIWRTR